MKTMTKQEFREEAIRRFGEDSYKWKFVCPMCKIVQTAEDLISAGISKEEAGKYIGYSCIGRFDSSKVCNWTLGGLFQIHTLEIKTDDGKYYPSFELAEE